MRRSIRLACAGSFALVVALAGGCGDFELIQQPEPSQDWQPTPPVAALPKPDLMYSGSYGHVPGRVGVDLPPMTASSQTVSSLRAATAPSCPATSIMDDEVGPTLHQMREFRHHLFLALPILDIYVEAVRMLPFEPSGGVFVPASMFGIEVSQELLDAIQSRFDLPIDAFVPYIGAWFANPAFCVVRDPTDELQTSVYVDRRGVAGVTSCDDTDAFPEYFRWNDDRTEFQARVYVPWGESPWDGNWSPTLADLFRPPSGSPILFTYDALTDTQRLVRMPSEPTYCSALVSQARGCGPDRCVELDLGLRFLSPGGIYADHYMGGMIENDVNRYTYIAGKADDHASAFRVRYHSAEDFVWVRVGDGPYTLEVRDRVLERHAALFDGAGCLIAYCAPVPANLDECYWQLDPPDANLSVPSLPFYEDAIAHEIDLDPFPLAFQVPAFPTAPDEPWAEFVVVRAGGDPGRAEDLIADGSADFDGAPFLDVISWGHPEDYEGAELWRLTPVAIDGRQELTRERMTGTVSALTP